MLVLSRRPGEALLIGDDIMLVLERVEPGKVTYEILADETCDRVTRELLEPLHLGDRICVQALAMRGCWVRIGIDAPREVRVDRAEKFEP